LPYPPNGGIIGAVWHYIKKGAMIMAKRRVVRRAGGTIAGTAKGAVVRRTGVAAPARKTRGTGAASPPLRHARGDSLGLKLKGRTDAVAVVKRGMPVAAVARLGRNLGVTLEALGRITNIAERTLQRRKQDNAGRLKADESERVLRVGLLLDRAVAVLGSLETARAWLRAPCPALGGKAPLAYADTEPGAREVEDVLGRIEHGVFS